MRILSQNLLYIWCCRTPGSLCKVICGWWVWLLGCMLGMVIDSCDTGQVLVSCEVVTFGECRWTWNRGFLVVVMDIYGHVLVFWAGGHLLVL